MIGDWPERDVVGANSLGIKTIFARYGDTFGVKNSGANWDIDDISELINIVESENEKYTALFKDYFLKSFSDRLSEYTNPKIDVQNKEILNENYTIVNSVLEATNERPKIKIDWRIYTKNSENPLIRDLIIEGLSLARTQKEEFSSILASNNGDINSLFETLENFTKN